MAQVRLNNIVKTYGPYLAVDDLCLTIEDGEFVALVGPSGCGKTTTLNLVAGLIELTSGEIHIGDRQVNDLDPKDRDIAMVFQNYALYPHMTVARNMGFGLRAARLPADEIDRRVKKAATLLGLENLLSRRPGELSGGQRQRVAMGRAIVRDPQVFLFDEPLSNLDAQLRNQVRTEIKKLHQHVRTTSIYVTHDQVEAMTLADRIVLLRDGRIEQVGTPNELFARPANRFVASFIGSPAMNFLPAQLENGEILLSGLRLPCPPLSAAPANQQITIGIRPEDILVGEASLQAPASCRFEAEIAVVEPMGSEALLMLSYGGHDLHVRLFSRHHPRAGARLGFAYKPAELHVFDAASDLALNR